MNSIFCLVIFAVLIVVTCADWSIKNDKDSSSIRAGTLFNLKISNTDLTKIDARVYYDSQAFRNFLLSPEGIDGAFCTLDTTRAPVATIDDLVIVFFQEVPAETVINCPLRAKLQLDISVEHQIVIDTDPETADSTVPPLTLTTPMAVELLLEVKDVKLISSSDPAALVEIPSFEMKFSQSVTFFNVRPNTVYGPLTFNTRLANDATTEVSGQPWLLNALNADFKSTFDKDVRIFSNKGNKEYYLISGPDSHIPTFSAEFNYVGQSDIIRNQAEKDIRSVVILKDSQGDSIEDSALIGKSPKYSETASLYLGLFDEFAENNFEFVFRVERVDDGSDKFEFSIGHFTADEIFGENSVLEYTLDGKTWKQLDTKEKSFSYSIPDLVAEKRVEFRCRFPAHGFKEDIVVTASLGGAKRRVTRTYLSRPFINAVEVKSIEKDVLTFNLEIYGSAQLFPGTFAFNSKISFSSGSMDVRAFSTEAPICTSDGADVSVSGYELLENVSYASSKMKFTNVRYKIGQKIIVTCTMNLLPGPKEGKEISIEVSNGKNARMTMNADPLPVATYNQELIVTAGAITNADNFNKILDRVITELGKIDPTKFADLTRKSFFYAGAKDINIDQIYAFPSFGRTIQFDNYLDTQTSNGSRLTLVFNGKGDENYEAITGVYTFADLTIELATSKSGFTNPAEFLNGNDAEIYERNQHVSHSYGVGCRSTAMCSNQVCSNNICTHWNHLTLKQQNAARKDDQDDSQTASIAITVFAIGLAFVALLF